MSALGRTGRIENLSERRELSDAAKALLADKAFGHVYLQLRHQWFDQLMDWPHDRRGAGRAGRPPQGARRHPHRARQAARQLPRRRPEGPQCLRG